MTLPYERFRAVESARAFLHSLLDPKQTPKVPKQVRKDALRVLRHFPMPHEMIMAAEKAPELFASQEEFLQRLQQRQEQRMTERKTKKYGGYETADTDIVIDGYRLICTCGACPEQYDVFNNENGSLVGYLRLRHGIFRADCPDVGGDTVYSANPAGDGIFEEHERMDYLRAAVGAIREYWNKLKKEYGNEPKQ